MRKTGKVVLVGGGVLGLWAHLCAAVLIGIGFGLADR